MPDTPLRSQFPIFKHNPAPWTYLDSAATSQKPQAVIDRMRVFFEQENANVHRATHEKARKVTHEYERTRSDVAAFIGASSAAEIIWTKGATEAFNLLSYSLEPILKGATGKRILLSESEHHANIVPWQQLAARRGLTIDVIPVNKQGVWDVKAGLHKLDNAVAIVALGHVSNALGNINPIQPFLQRAREVGAMSVVDGAQAVAHMPVNVQALDCDFYVFSGHKVFGPTGIGVLYGKSELLHQMAPYQTGGEMISHVSMQTAEFLPPPQRFETGTPNIAGVLGLGAAIQFVSQYRNEIEETERRLSKHLRETLAQVPGLTIWGDRDHHVATASFTHEVFNNHDLGVLLDQQGIALRVGHHCTMPLMQALGLEGTLRASLGPYNTLEDIDRLLLSLNKAIASLRNDEPSPAIAPSVDDEHVSKTPHFLPLAERITQAKGWDQVYREVMLAGKALPRHSDIQQPENEVHGCESKVWVVVSMGLNGLEVKLDSPSKVVRGLLAIMLEPLMGQSAAAVRTHDMAAYLANIGLAHHLSESRGNGLRAVWQKVIACLNDS